MIVSQKVKDFKWEYKRNKKREGTEALPYGYNHKKRGYMMYPLNLFS